jgi:hypothetical protein
VNSDPAPAGTSLVRAPDVPNIGDDVRLQKLWLATQRREWRSLAVLGASSSIDTLGFAELLAKLSWWYRGQVSCVIDLRDLSLRLVDYHKQEVKSQIDAGACVVIALRSTFENPTAVPMARSADAVVLCIDLGNAAIKAAEQTLVEVGRERVLGAIVLKQRTGKPAKNGR